MGIRGARLYVGGVFVSEPGALFPNCPRSEGPCLERARKAVTKESRDRDPPRCSGVPRSWTFNLTPSSLVSGTPIQTGRPLGFLEWGILPDLGVDEFLGFS